MLKSSCIIFIALTAVLGQTTYYNPNLPQSDSIPLSERQFRVVYEWRTVDFAFKTEEERGQARRMGKFIDKNVLISDVKAFANRLYVTMPRMLPGVPATLGWIIAPDNNGRSDPLVEPFPSWDMNEAGNCAALQFVQAIAVDADGIMWVVDSGRINTLTQQEKPFSCVPKLVLFDLKRNGTMLMRYEFPEEIVRRGTNYLNKIVIDDAFGGFAYITDNSGSDPGIVVFSREMRRSWKVRDDRSMRAAANAADFAVNGTSLRFSIHIDGIALGPYYNPNTGETSSMAYSTRTAEENYERNVYFCPLSSYHLYSIPASILRDPDFPRRATPSEVRNIITDYGLKSSQTDGMIMDNKGVLYFGLLKEHAIAQWDSFEPFMPNNQHIIAKDDDFIQWTDGMSFDENGYLYVVVNRLHNFVAGRLNPVDVNFRILRARTGGMSYVFTNTPGPGNTGLNRVPKVEIFDNGISSTTPFFNSLESRGGFSFASKSEFAVFNLFIAVVLVVVLR